MSRPGETSTLAAIKTLHTIIWAVFAGCIVALPLAALKRRFDLVAALTLLAGLHPACVGTNQNSRLGCARLDRIDPAPGVSTFWAFGDDSLCPPAGAVLYQGTA
jgi:hypothetical protein